MSPYIPCPQNVDFDMLYHGVYNSWKSWESTGI